MSNSYAEFRNQLLPRVLTLRESADFHDPVPVSEKLVQALWADQLFDHSNLRTREGLDLRIIHPGRWNGEGGPDFMGAELELEGKIIKGDVEIHLHGNGWKEHHHVTNPLYGKVILDVCLWEGVPFAPLSCFGGGPVHQLVLQPHLQESLNELVESLDMDGYPFSMGRTIFQSPPLVELSDKERARLIHSAGLYRFEKKSNRLGAMQGELSLNETAYITLAEALGYKHNKGIFHQIAESLPLTKLRKIKSADGKIEALLAQAANFSPRVAQVRPANHPERRLAALALLVHSHPDLAEWFETLARDSKKLLALPSLEHPFWIWHAHRRSSRSKRSMALIGKSRWLEIVVNGVLPLIHSKAVHCRDSIEAARLLGLYENLPAPSINRSCRQTAFDLCLAQPRKAAAQQGLIQLYQDFDLLLPERH